MTPDQTQPAWTEPGRPGWFGPTVACLALIATALSAGCSVDTTGDLAGPDADIQTDTGLDAGPPGDATTDGSRPEPRDGSGGWDFGTPDGAGEGPLSLEGLVPPSGPVSGGNVVRVQGGGLADTTLFVGGSKAELRTAGNGWTAVIPSAEGPGPVTVKAVTSAGDSVSLSDAYTYVEDVTIDSVTPRRVPVEGGVQVTVRGSGFQPPLGVTVGGRAAVEVERLSSTRFRLIVPSGEAGPADLRVTTSLESVARPGAIRYVAPVDLQSVDPAAGPVEGGQTVSLQVQGVDASTEVRFGGAKADILGREDGTLTVRTPAHSAGLVDVTVTGPGRSAVVEEGYLYVENTASGVASLRPTAGPSDGGTDVILVGQGLDAPGIDVEFDSTPAQIVERHETWLQVETPSHPPGTVDVVVRGTGEGVQRLSGAFTYLEPLHIDTVEPGAGPAAGGTSVQLQGEGFSGVEEVFFGSVPADFSVDSDGRMTVTSPAHGPGAVDIRLTRGRSETTRADGFRYREPLEIWGFSPIRGAVAGGTRVVLRGRGFGPGVSALFGGEQVGEAEQTSPYRMAVRSPPGEVGRVDVEASREGKSVSGPYRYEYFNPASRYGGVDGGPINGAVNVSVYSESGGPIENAFVMLSTRSDTNFSGVTNASGQLTLSGPGVMGAQTVTATAAGFSSATVREVNAQNVTFFLSPLNPSQGGGGGGGGDDGPPSGRITGQVLGPKKVDEPGATTEFDIAKVAVTRRQRNYVSVEPGPGAITFGEGRYAISSRIGDVAAVALCGDYEASTDTFTPRFIGVHRYINVAEGSEVQADIRCSHRLDQTLPVKINRPIYAPRGPNRNRAEVYFDFGFEGVFPAPTPATGLGSVLEVPDIPSFDGPFADVTLTVVAGSYTGGGTPFSEMVRSDVTETGSAVEMPALLDVPEPVEPLPGSVWEGRSIRFQATGPPYPDFWRVILYNQNGREFWEYIMDGRETRVELPSFPDFQDLPADQRPEPYPSGRVYMILLGVDAESARLDNFTYQDLYASRWNGYSMVRWNVDRRPGQ
jgi:hypothetical protein